MSNPLIDKIIKNSTLKHTSKLSESTVFNNKDVIQTPVPMINVALSGKIDGGMSSGITMACGKSKNFKSGISLLMAKSFITKYPEGVIIFCDSEFGSPETYFKGYDIPLDQVVHIPLTNIEELKFEMMAQLDALDIKDKVFILVDSIGNIASKKEVEDALNEKAAADMSRAKQLKSLFRIVTPHLTLKNIPMVVINHVYDEMSLYPKQIVSGGTGSYYSADTIWIINRRTDKEEKEVIGHEFIITIEKSRFLKEGAKIGITLSNEHGIDKWSGIFDLAIEFGFIKQHPGGWYTTEKNSTTKMRKDAFDKK